MPSYNKVIVIGNMGADPSIKESSTYVSVATNESWKDKEGEIQEKTTWHKVTVSGQSACFTRDYIHKGNLVWVEGKNESRSWEDDNGEKKYDYSVKALRVENYSPKGGDGSSKSEDDIPY